MYILSNVTAHIKDLIDSIHSKGQRAKDFWGQHKDHVLDAGSLAVFVFFAIWVMVWHSAHLAAPTAAIASAAIATYERHTSIRAAYRLAVAIGLLATGFMWLLSTTEKRSELAPANAAEGWIIIAGWGITAGTVVIATLAAVLPVNYFTRIPRNPKRKLLIDYTVGVTIPTIAMIPTIAILGIIETSIGKPGELAESIPALIFFAPLYGWFLTYALRAKSTSVWTPPAQGTGPFSHSDVTEGDQTGR